MALALAAGCTLRRAGTGEGEPRRQPQESFAELLNPLATYESMGFVTGDPRFAAVGRFAHLAGPGDSTLVLFGLSFSNNALQFQRAEAGYAAGYRVELSFHSGRKEVARLRQVQEVRVATFRETGRMEESVIFQTRQPLPPGAYLVELEVRDLGSNNGFRRRLDLLVPEFGPHAQPLSPPLIVYQVEPRTATGDAPSFIINPRATVAFGDGAALIYLEGYDPAADSAIVDVVDAADEPIWTDTVMLQPQKSIGTAVTSISADSLPVGALKVRARLLRGGPTVSAPILVGLSERWILANYREVVDFLRYAATPAELDSLRDAPPEERAQRWRAFWDRKDPVPTTPENEFFDVYFGRIREANRLFAEPQRLGWLTDRGEVYITLGTPDQVFSSPEIGPGGRIRWIYDRSLGFELRLDFVDRTGFGHYELTADSQARFHEAVSRLNPRG